MTSQRRPRTPDEIRELREQIARFPDWYHNINLGDGIWTCPNHPHGDYPGSRWKVIEPYVPADLHGATVLDLGCNAGYFSLEFKKRGAAYVLGVDRVQWMVDQAIFVARELGYPDIDYRCMSAYDVDKLTDVPSKFDYVLFLGLFYHLRHPLLMLDKLSALVGIRMYFQTMLRGRRDGIKVKPDYPIEEYAIFENPAFPAMYFIENSFGHDSSNRWMANENGIMAMLRNAGFTNFTQTQAYEIFVCEAATHPPLEQ